MKAIVLGATGATGRALVDILIKDDRFSQVLCVGRRSLPIANDKLKQLEVDFDDPASWEHQVQGDVLFSAFGTTIKKAGTKEQQYKIDFTYQYMLAQMASKNGVKKYVLVSSSGANAKSSFFYMRMKGELDEAVKKLNFESVCILKPSVLVSQREENRVGELIGIKMGYALAKLPVIKKYKPIKVEDVAQAMVNGVFSNKKFTEYTLDEVFDLAKKTS